MASIGPISLHSYVVEFVTPSGETTRREVEQSIDSIDVQVGAEVPLLVSPDGTKVELDEEDPRINMMAAANARRKADEARFRESMRSPDARR
ncbi:hypothetical protein AB0M91_11395 [Micromonospora rifamycinica]|uniref:hypothetical protein n=1 Tax=Micromonospora rifamycinica TaxID=291594 RepID=UPI00344008AD